MRTVETLIDKAVNNGMSMYAISKASGVPDSTLSDIQNGKLGMSPKVAALIAPVAEVDPREAALLAIIEGEKNPEKRAKLAELLQAKDWRKRSILRTWRALFPSLIRGRSV